MRLEQVEEARAEGVQALRGRDAGPERRRPGDQRVLEVLGLVVEQREREPGPVAEAPVQRAGADAGGLRHVLHRDGVDPALGDERARSRQDALAIASRVGPLTGLFLKLRELEHQTSTGAVTSRTRSAIRSV